MAYQWQTVEHAAVTLGMSTRTIARRIAQGKFETRLQDGRREVFINVDEPAPADSAQRQAWAQAAAAFSSKPSSPSIAPPPQPASSAAPDVQPATAEVAGGYVSYSHPLGQDVISPADAIEGEEEDPATEAALILAEDRAHRAEMTLTVFHQSVTLAASEARRARMNSNIAWGAVAVLAILVTIAVGWTASKVTQAQLKADELQGRLVDKADEAGKLAQQRDHITSERDKYRDELAAASAERARAEGRLQELQNQAQLASDEVKATRATMMEMRLSAARDAVENKSAAPTTAPTMTKVD